MNITVSWDAFPCSLVATCFGGPATSLLNMKKSDIINSTNIKTGWNVTKLWAN